MTVVEEEEDVIHSSIQKYSLNAYDYCSSRRLAQSKEQNKYVGYVILLMQSHDVENAKEETSCRTR